MTVFSSSPSTQFLRSPESVGRLWLAVSVGLAIAVLLGAMFWGEAYASPDVFYRLRVPRVLAAFGVGGLLELAGVLLQALLRNPLAEPYMLGAASGASFCLLVGTVLGLAWWMLQGLAFPSHDRCVCCV